MTPEEIREAMKARSFPVTTTLDGHTSTQHFATWEEREAYIRRAARLGATVAKDASR